MEELQSFDLFESLSGELQLLIGEMLSLNDQAMLAGTSTYQWHLQHAAVVRRFFLNNAIIDLAGTYSSSFLITAAGELYACGRNSDGRLGVGDNKPRLSLEKVHGVSNVKCVLATLNRTLVLTKSGAVFVCGETFKTTWIGEFAEPQINHQFEHIEFAPAMLDDADQITLARPLEEVPAYLLVSPPAILDMQMLKLDDPSTVLLGDNGRVYILNTSREDGYISQKIPNTQLFLPVPQLENIKWMKMYPETAFFINNKDECFVMGENFVGQLALESRKKYYHPHKMTPYKVKNVWSDGYTTFIQTLAGNFYACGANNDGQLGVKSQHEFHTVLQPIQGLTNVIDILLNSSSVFALTNDGKVYAWGRNNRGQLGLGDEAGRSYPTQIQGLPSIVNIKRVEDNTIFTAYDGQTYICGINIKTMPGLEGVDDRSLKPLSVPTLYNIKKSVIGGNVYSLLSNDGIVYGWGNNLNYALGLEDEDYCVVQIIMLPHVKKMIANLSPIHLISYVSTEQNYYYHACLEMALTKLKQDISIYELQEVLYVVLTTRLRAEEQFQAIFPGYQALPDNKEVINAYAQLLHKYQYMLRIEVLTSQLKKFIKLLQKLVDREMAEYDQRYHYNGGLFFKPHPQEKIVFHSLLRDMREIPVKILQQAAQILIDHLPPIKNSQARKRAAEENLEENEYQLPLKKLKK